MNLHEYIRQLQALEKKYGNIKVIYAGDSEGNWYDEVNYIPTPGHFNENASADVCFDDVNNMKPRDKVNCVCIN